MRDLPDKGYSNYNIWLPFRGEFGSRLWWFVPAFGAAKHPKLICHEGHQKCLYPDADEYYEVPSPENYNQTSATGAPGDAVLFDQIMTNFGKANYIFPTEVSHWPKSPVFVKPLKDYTIFPDVVLCKRMKTANFGSIWYHWDDVGNALNRAGYSVYFADNFNTDEISWAMMHAKVVLTVHTGSCFLCQYVSVHPWILTTSEGRGGVCGAPFLDTGILKNCDISKVGWTVIPLWEKPEAVVDVILNYLKTGENRFKGRMK